MRKYIYTFFFALFCLSCASQSIFAATAETVTNQIQDVTAQIQALDKEISQYKNQIAETSSQAATLAHLIKELTLTRDKLLLETKQTQKKITVTNIIIGTLADSITKEQQSILDSKKVLTALFREVQQNEYTPFIEKLIADKNIIEMSREYSTALTINEKLSSHIADLTLHEKSLNEAKSKKENEQATLTALKKELDQKKVAVDVSKKEKDTLLSETKNKESNYQKILADRQKKRDAFEKDLRDYEAQLKFILNPKLLPGEGSGILAWPLDTVYITQFFGKTVSSKKLYVSGSHSGVDLRASIGTPVKSMGTGTIIGTGDTDLYCKGASFGKWVFIKYNNGLSSTFGHLSVITGLAGQSVVAGDVVGLSGNTGHSTGPHLHVTVYASQGADVQTIPSISCNGKVFTMPIAPTSAYLDPMLYFPKIPPASVKNDTNKD